MVKGLCVCDEPGGRVMNNELPYSEHVPSSFHQRAHRLFLTHGYMAFETVEPQSRRDVDRSSF